MEACGTLFVNTRAGIRSSLQIVSALHLLIKIKKGGVEEIF